MWTDYINTYDLNNIFDNVNKIITSINKNNNANSSHK